MVPCVGRLEQPSPHLPQTLGFNVPAAGGSLAHCFHNCLLVVILFLVKQMAIKEGLAGD